MHYKELFRAIDWFKQDTYAYDLAYIRSRKTTDWKKLHMFSDDDITHKVLGFLNEWRCRIGITREVIIGIKEAFSEILPHLQALEGETLEDINFRRLVSVGGIEREISSSIYFAMSRMINVGYRFRHVAASKLLHMANPGLFVMWDNFIIEAYRLSPSAHSYTYSFMPTMQREVNEAIKSYMKDYGYDRNQAVEKIRSYGGGKTLAKLVDEFNYWRFSSGTRSDMPPGFQWQLSRSHLSTPKEEEVKANSRNNLKADKAKKYLINIDFSTKSVVHLNPPVSVNCMRAFGRELGKGLGGGPKIRKDGGIVYVTEDEARAYFMGAKRLYWDNREVHNLKRCGNCRRDPTYSF